MLKLGKINREKMCKIIQKSTRSNYKYKHLLGGGVHRVDVQYKSTFLTILIGYNNTSTTVL